MHLKSKNERTYLDNFNDNIIAHVRKSTGQGGKAFENRKVKNQRKCWPRGKFFRRFLIRETNAESERTRSELHKSTVDLANFAASKGHDVSAVREGLAQLAKNPASVEALERAKSEFEKEFSEQSKGDLKC